ncbi:MAG: DUF6263 family protein [Bacteroidales bacterium]|jgi:hypothetical protein|nr:DUF6263 family protein [Bacteroidales bacterium]
MKKFLLSCITVLFCVSVLAQDIPTLKMQLEKNKVYRLNSFSEQVVSQTVNGVQQTTESKVQYTLSLKMIDETAEFMIMEVHFDTLITNTDAMGKIVAYSSANEGDIGSAEMGDVLSCIMNRLSKNALYVKMDYTGKPLEIVNLKMLSDMVLRDTSAITLTGPTAAAVKTQLISSVSDDHLKTLIGMFTWCLPAGEVTAGDSWDVTQQMNSGGMMLEIITSYHLDGIDGNNANITAESSIKPVANATPIETGVAKVTYDDLKGMSKTDMVIDIRTGLTVESKGKTHITGNLDISGPGFSMQMPMDINGESSVIALQ